MGLKRILTTLGLGVGAMYFMDPERGDRRRAQVRDEFSKLRSEARNVWTEGSDDLASRARSLGNKAASAPQDAARGAMDMLSGQGEGGKFSMNMDRPGDRLLAMSGGGLLALFGLTRGGIIGKAAMLAGLNFAAQGLIRKNYLGDMMTKMRGESGEGGIEFRKAIRINASVEDVFAFWQNYENFPRFMSHLAEVRDLGDGRSHWVATGPLALPVEWDALITELRPNSVIAWESVPGSEVYNAGRVRFESVDGATRVDVFMTYNPPGGLAGHAVAQLFGADPKSAMDEDLVKLKSLIEQSPAGDSEAERYRPASAISTERRKPNQDRVEDMNALDEASGGNASGLNGGASRPAERKPGADFPGSSS